jgi:hypothetical protein
MRPTLFDDEVRALGKNKVHEATFDIPKSQHEHFRNMNSAELYNHFFGQISPPNAELSEVESSIDGPRRGIRGQKEVGGSLSAETPEQTSLENNKVAMSQNKNEMSPIDRLLGVQGITQAISAGARLGGNFAKEKSKGVGVASSIAGGALSGALAYMLARR